MSLTTQEKDAAKAKAATYLEKSIYTLSSLLGVDPEVAMAAVSVSDLSQGESDSEGYRLQSLETLFTQVECLKKIA
jgi:hypothetical protein